MNVNDALLSQFDLSWNMLEQAIKIVPDKLFRITINSWSFVGIVYHIIETADFYSRNTPDGMPWENL